MRRFILKWLAVLLGMKAIFIGAEMWWLVEEAKSLVAKADTLPEAGGEYKRGQVYAQMIKRCPDIPRHRIGLAIELAVSRRK